MRYEYSLPEDSAAVDIVESLSQRFGLRDQGGQRWEICYFDTFDWRLYKRGLVLEQHRHSGANHLHWRSISSESPQRVLPNTRMPHFAHELPTGAFRDRLCEVTEPRALLPQVIIHTLTRTLLWENEDGKTLLRLMVETGRLVDCDQSRTAPVVSRRLRLEGLRGYDKQCDKVRRAITRLGVEPAEEDLMVQALAYSGRRPGAYRVRPRVILEPQVRADEAARRLLAAFLDVMKRNLPGILARTDAEFLHDFRTSLRRARALLPELRDVFAKRTLDRYRRDLKWLGDITSPVRDLDVLWLALDDYGAMIADDTQREAFLSMCGPFVERELEQAYEQLNERLQSARFTRLMESLGEFVTLPTPRRTPLANAMREVGEYANERLARRFRRLRKGAKRAGQGDDPELLHEVRILAKRSRYLLDAFQSLYPARAIKTLRSSLRDAQDTLGEHHDCYVHELALRHLAERMRLEEAMTTPVAEAFASLAASLRRRQEQLADEAVLRLRAFSKGPAKALCDQLFAFA